MVKFLKKTGLCALILFLFACGDSDLLKFDNLEGVKNWEPDYKLQLAFANYDVWRLVKQADDGDSTLIEKDNQILIRHFQKDMASLDVSEVIKFQNEIASIPLRFRLPDAVVGQPLQNELNISLPEDSVSIVFEDGNLTRVEGKINCRYELTQYPFDYQVTVVFTNVFSDSGDSLRFTFSPSDVKDEGPKSVVFDMASSPNRLKWKADITIPAGESVNLSELNIGIKLDDFSFTRVEGTMKTRNVRIDEGEFDMGVEFWDNFDGSFYFANPRVDLTVRNYGLGVPVQMDMDFVAYGENGQYISLEPKNNYKPTFKGWNPEDGGVAVETQSYDTTNSNIADLLSLPPKEKIAYGGKIIVAPDSTQPLTILNTGRASVDAYVEIPLHLSAKGLVFRDTIDDIDISDADKIKEAKIIVRADNQIPLGLGSGHLYLLDEAKNCIDSVEIKRFLDAPEIDGEGNVIPAEEEKEMPAIVLSEDNILHLNETKYMLISVEATTSNEGKEPVVIKADAMLKLKLILEATLNLEDVF